ncbi:predicted protein [Chaetoceros tenuissimus]|uniref:Uncharacterized protein n=1 Tax=Chaetoceros tenuissimus TaxID=426638 RepID=A0AAD3GZY7_9STRA|nr:predicted protein [Chaetoceros tenuissimus]
MKPFTSKSLLSVCAFLLLVVDYSVAFTLSGRSIRLRTQAATEALLQKIHKSNSIEHSNQNVLDSSTMVLNSSLQKDEEKKEQGLLLKAADSLFLLYSFGMQFGGTLFGLGLLLNICGYDYSFDMTHGLEIDTISKMQQAHQFEQAAKMTHL